MYCTFERIVQDIPAQSLEDGVLVGEPTGPRQARVEAAVKVEIPGFSKEM